MSPRTVSPTELRDLMSEETRYERAGAIFLDERRRPVGAAVLGQGCQDMVEVDLDVLAAMATEAGARGFIFVHSHPLNDRPRPSKGDIAATETLARLFADEFNLPLVDHHIFGRFGRKVFSFAGAGMMPR